ncbi:MAG: DUF1302 family protein [Halioglobus sp.]|nr:DUF1302 family protein [Halioglobus sp.]
MKKRLFALSLLAASMPAAALQFEFDNGLVMSVDSTVTWGAQWRVQDRDDDLTGRALMAAVIDDPFLPLTDLDYVQAETVKLNGDDGNHNFDTGLISNRVTFLVDVDATWENYGAFLRGRAFYDQVYRDDDTDLDDDVYQGYNSGAIYGGDASPGEFPRRTRDMHGNRFELLDAFVYGTWEIPGDRLLDLRVGRQLINWGEAVFYQGVNSIQNRVDAQAANTPGVEVKEILLPTGSIYLQVDVVPNLTMEAYYQFEWIKNDLNGVGSYFSTTDQVGPGAYSFIIPTPNLGPGNPIGGNEFNLRGVPRMEDEEASDSGQWGLAFHFVTQGGSDIGVYHVVGHDKKPSFVLDYIDVAGSPVPVPIDYRLRYYEDIKGTAASITTVVGDTNVTGELSFLDGTPMVNAAGDPQRENLAKVQVGGTHLFGPNRFWDDAVLTFETYYATVTSANQEELNADDSAFGYSVLAEPTLRNVMQGWDLVLPIYFKHDVDGLVRELQAFEEAKVLSLGLRGIYLSNFTAQFNWAIYMGGGTDNLIRDRDNISVTLKYNF